MFFYSHPGLVIRCLLFFPRCDEVLFSLSDVDSGENVTFAGGVAYREEEDVMLF